MGILSFGYTEHKYQIILMKTLHPIKLCDDFDNIFFLFVEQTNHIIIIIIIILRLPNVEKNPKWLWN